MADENDSFLRVTFRGGRFDRHAIPVDVLAELAALQQALLRLASNEFKRRNPERKRRPRGFAQSARLYLRKTEHNCFTAVMTRDAAPLLPNIDPESFDVFAQARSQLFEVFRGAAVPGLDQTTLKTLKRIGERLDDGEAIELRATEGGQSARVDFESRKRIADALHEDVEQVTELEGEVDRIDDSREQFALKLRDGRIVTVPLERAVRSDVATAFMQRPAVLLRVRGRVQWSDPPRVQEVPEIEVFDHERKGEIDKLWARLEVLAGVPDGWLHGEGVAPSAEALTRAREVLARLLVEHAEIPRPKVFPIPEGGVQAEWVLGRVVADARFSMVGGTIVAEAVRADDSSEWDETFSDHDVTRDDASKLAAWLRGVAGLTPGVTT